MTFADLRHLLEPETTKSESLAVSQFVNYDVGLHHASLTR